MESPLESGAAAEPSGGAVEHRVLLVDDERSVTEALRSGLLNATYEVLTANSVEDALTILETHPVDVVVSDERMPGVSGTAFLTSVQRGYPDIARVMLKGDVDFETALGAVHEAQVFRFLTKPCNAEDLAACIDQAITFAERERRRPRTPPGKDLNAILDRALETVWMAFQPILNAADSSLFGYEALLRTRDEDLYHPGLVFQAAEDLGRVAEVEAIARARTAERLGELPDGAVVFSNVHPVSLESGELYSVDNPLLPWADRIVLEIIERSSIDDHREICKRMDVLRERGFRFAIDDLGAGYAGLTSFAQLEPEVVKFDMDLIQGIAESQTRARLVEAITTLCRDMRILTVAEGIETESDHQRVVALGCDLLQGFRFASPTAEFALPPFQGNDQAG